MEGLDDLEFLSEYREDNRIEAKRAQGGLCLLYTSDAADD